MNFAALDHWYGFFVALPSLIIGLIAVVSIPSHRPQGYIQRTALGVFGFMLFDCGLSHPGYMAKDQHYRPIVLTLLLCVALNDVVAFTVGKLIGGPKLLPAISPGKTISGAVGSLTLVTPLVAWLSHGISVGTPMDRTWLLLSFGALASMAAQAGDLMLSAIKRDLGIKDMGAVLPGHGGVLDRYNSSLLVSPDGWEAQAFVPLPNKPVGKASWAGSRLMDACGVGTAVPVAACHLVGALT